MASAPRKSISAMEAGMYGSTVELRPSGTTTYGSQPKSPEKSESDSSFSKRATTGVVIGLVLVAIAAGIGIGIGIGAAAFKSSSNPSWPWSWPSKGVADAPVQPHSTTPEATIVPASRASTTPEGTIVPVSRASNTPLASIVPVSRASTTPEASIVPVSRASTTPEATIVPVSRSPAATTGVAVADGVPILQPFGPSAASNFAVRGPHSLSPTSLWGTIKGPYPTNTWWQNLVLGDGTLTIAPLPYQLQSQPNGLVVCMPQAFVGSTAITTQFLRNAVLGASEGLSARTLLSYDDLSVAVKWTSGGAGSMTSYIVRGSPYVTVEYASLTPSLSSQHAVMSVNGETTPGTVSGSRFVLSLNNGQQWIVYASAPISFQWSASGLTATAQQSAVTIRIACVPSSDPTAMSALDSHQDVYAVSGVISAVASADGSSTATFSFGTKSMSGSGDASTLLLTALPHHVDVLASGGIVSALSYSTIRGAAVGVVGNVWALKESLTSITWTAPRAVPDDKKQAVLDALSADVAGIVMTKTDTYFGGKEMSKYARLALVADELGSTSLAQTARQKVQDRLEQWFTAAMPDNIMYDPTWGGLVTSASAGDPGSDFGFGYYNDHHFHLGYFLYAAAVVGKGNPAWLASRANVLRELARDFANPSSSDAYFPRFRNFDVYEGHSWAAGLFQFADNRNQESTSEAINGYYGLYLLGVALGDDNIRDTGRLFLAMEMRSAMKYWHIPPGSAIYPAPFSAGGMVGMVWSTKVDYATWFGANVEFIHCIQMLPFTPITEEYLPASFISTEYDVLKTSLTRGSPPIDMGWRGYVYMAHAIIDKATAWSEVQTLTAYDDGNTATNTLYWVATRP
eukprot:Opistho-1_new@55694